MTHTHIIDGRKVGELALGIEFECMVPNADYGGSQQTRYESEVNGLTAWAAGYDCGFQEVRADPVIRLSDAMAAMDELLDVLDAMSTKYGWTQVTGIMGMHVHINVEDPRYGSLDAECLFDTYMRKYQHQAEALTRAETRINQRQWCRNSHDEARRYAEGSGAAPVWNGGNHAPIPAELRWADVVSNRNSYNTNPFNSKSWDFSPRVFSEWPTIEMRTWDSTGDRGLLRARFDMIRSMAVDTVHAQKRKGRQEVELVDNSVVRGRPERYGARIVDGNKVEVVA